jgi:hypothetical protein
MNNQGVIGVAVVPTDSNVISTNIDLGAPNLFTKNERISCKEGPLSGIAGHDAIIQRTFKDSAAVGVNQMGAWGSEILVAYITGGPATTASIQIRVVYHYELVFPTTTAMNSFATKTAQSNETVLSGSNFVSKALGGVVKGGAEEVEKRTMSAAMAFGKYLVRIGAAAVGGYVAGPTGAAIGYQGSGMIMDVD